MRPASILLVALAVSGPIATAQTTRPTIPSESKCQPIAQRTGENGCWIIVDAPVGRLADSPVFWHIESFPTRAAAEAAKGPRGTVVESFGKVWLYTIAPKDRHSASGTHVASVGPLPIKAGGTYSAMYMETVNPPGFDSAVHTHSGPEAWYMLEGAMCLETPDGVTHAAAGQPASVRVTSRCCCRRPARRCGDRWR
jgi:hypothetical protein